VINIVGAIDMKKRQLTLDQVEQFELPDICEECHLIETDPAHMIGEDHYFRRNAHRGCKCGYHINPNTGDKTAVLAKYGAFHYPNEDDFECMFYDLREEWIKE
jgi:hypothetical protein